MPTSAAVQVFGVAELAEYILSYCELEEISILDNVNNLLHNLITSSRKLQRLLSLEPATWNTDRLEELYLPYLDFFSLQNYYCGSEPADDGEQLHILSYVLRTYNRNVLLSATRTPVKCTAATQKPIGTSWRMVRISQLALKIRVITYPKVVECTFGKDQCALGDVAECLRGILAQDPYVQQVREELEAIEGRN